MKKILAASLAALIWSHVQAHDHAAPAAHQHVAKAQFVENQGQWDAPFQYKAEAGPLALFIGREGLTWSLLQPDHAEVIHEASHRREVLPVLKGHAWRVTFVRGASDRFQPRDAAAHGTSFFLGNDPQRWRSDVPAYGEVTQAGIWPGVDMRVYMDHGHFKYDMLLGPGADPSVIGLSYEGLDGLRLALDGSLVLATSVGEVVEAAPVAWYADAPGVPLACRYVLREGVLGFELPGADRSRAIVIDPTLIASTLSGSTSTNYGHCATYDNIGNIYTGAISFGQGYPVTVGAFQGPFGGSIDIAVSKLNPDGSELLYATYIGGALMDHPHSLVVDDDSNLWVLGTSSSLNYPVTAGAFDVSISGTDIVISKLDPGGTALLGSTFIGGGDNDGVNGFTFNYGDTYRGEIIVDAAGNALVASCTSSADFPVTAGAIQPIFGGGQDAVAFSLNPTCTALNWSTFLGGSGGDMAFGIRSASDGSYYVCGGTDGQGFPTTAGAYSTTHLGEHDAFICRIGSNGASLIASTLWGTDVSEEAFFIQVDNLDKVYIYGQCTDILTPQPADVYYQEGGNFMAKFSTDLSTLEVQTSFGAVMVPVAFLVDACRNIYFSGYSITNEPPATGDALYAYGGFYLAVFAPDMTDLNYATYYIGAGHVDGGTSRFDPNGVVYQAVCTSGGFPTTPNAYGTTQGAWDIGVFKIDLEQSGVQAGITTSSNSGCVPATISFTADGNATDHIWDMGDGSPILTGETVTHVYLGTGAYTVMLIGIDSASCNIRDTAYVLVTIVDPQQFDAQFTAVPISSCDGYGVELTNTTIGGTDQAWSFGDGGTSTEQAPDHSYNGPGSYVVTLVVTDDVCNVQDTATQTVVIPPATLPYDPDSPVSLCSEVTLVLDAGPGFDTYDWGTGETTRTISVDEAGTYTIEVTSGICTASGVIAVLETPLPASLPDRQACAGETVLLSVSVPVNSITWNTGSTEATIPAMEGTYWFEAVDTSGCTFRDTLDVVRIAPTDGVDFIPNVFTPNGDALNDEFKVDAPGLRVFSMQVFNRWGAKVFETRSVGNGWRGTMDNGSSLAPDGTYYYIINFTDVCSEEREGTRKGHVTLLR